MKNKNTVIIKEKGTGIRKWRKTLFIGLSGAVTGALIFLAFNQMWVRSAKDENCMICHVHPHVEQSWKLSTHYNSKSGVKTGCADCHLPPKGSFDYARAKMKTGAKDIWSWMVKKTENIDWESKKTLEYAPKIVYNESCKACHVQLFPERLSKDGITAHLYYEENEKKLNLQCISCHLDAGHYNPNYSHARMTGIPVAAAPGEIYTKAAEITGHEHFTETIPDTHVAFEMKAIPGGTLAIGSPDNEPFRRPDEGPVKKVAISPFFMCDTEVTWDQFWVFFAETYSEGRILPETIYANNLRADLSVDAISGPTPPFGNPDQGWGAGARPAITMTHYAAETYCQWLSMKTGKNYRLPTEAEWEYAARGGTETPYFFPGNPRKYSGIGFLRSIFKPDTAQINRYVIYALNSKNRTGEPSGVHANPFGLKNMLGNVMEYCSDRYAKDAYARLRDGEVDPTGPASGSEYVVRGGSFFDDASGVRSAARGYTEHDRWLRTDPQQPKSIWWYSDVKAIGFRVVCDMPGREKHTGASPKFDE